MCNKVIGYVCGDCLGPLEMKGYIQDRYLWCPDCQLKNCFVKDKSKNG